MSSENVEIVKKAAAAIERGDVEAIFELGTEDALYLPGRSALQGGYVGRAGMRKWLADTAETFEYYAADWTEFHDAGDKVVMIGTVTVRPRGGGPEARIPGAFVFTFEDGKIVRAEDLRDRTAALESVGLTP